MDIKVLLVDDEGDFREATSTALGRRGFAVETAAGGESALEILERSAFDIVVLDLRMDGLSGTETLQELRRRGVRAPVVILTGHGGLDDALVGLELGIVDFLQKPVAIEHLADRLRQLSEGDAQVPLREKRIDELMAPASSYRRVYADDPLSVVFAELKTSLVGSESSSISAPGLRTLLVYDRSETFVGCLRAAEVLDALLPLALRDSPYASYLTGMFLAQCKLIGQRRVAELLDELVSVDAEAPLLEAVHLMSTHRLVSLPVIRNGALVGVIRERDLLMEAASCVGHH